MLKTSNMLRFDKEKKLSQTNLATQLETSVSVISLVNVMRWSAY